MNAIATRIRGRSGERLFFLALPLAILAAVLLGFR